MVVGEGFRLVAALVGLPIEVTRTDTAEQARRNQRYGHEEDRDPNENQNGKVAFHLGRVRYPNPTGNLTRARQSAEIR